MDNIKFREHVCVRIILNRTLFFAHYWNISMVISIISMIINKSQIITSKDYISPNIHALVARMSNQMRLVVISTWSTVVSSIANHKVYNFWMWLVKL